MDTEGPRFVVEFGDGWVTPDPAHPDRKYLISPPPDPDAPPPQPLGPEWRDVGYVVEGAVCGVSLPLIDNGAPCKFLAGHLDAKIPHTTKNGLWWFP